MNAKAFRFGITSLAALLLMSCIASAQEGDKIELKSAKGCVEVTLGGQPFTSLIYDRPQKPILYPVFGPRQTPMTRNWPMKSDTEGEANDHPHHQSIWFGHEINGIDFWAHRSGVIKTTEVSFKLREPKIITRSNWIRSKDNEKILTDETVYQFGGNKEYRWIDYVITLKASEMDLALEDSKEGCFAIRTHPDLRLNPDPKRGVQEVFGKALNSAGDQGKSIWGKPAKWVLYSGKIDNQPSAIAMFDHPSNLRHPTTWHARDYGLVAANPFGLHYFQKKEEGAGEVKLKKGESLTLRYRITLFGETPGPEQLEQQFREFASLKQ